MSNVQFIGHCSLLIWHFVVHGPQCAFKPGRRASHEPLCELRITIYDLRATAGRARRSARAGEHGSGTQCASSELVATSHEPRGISKVPVLGRSGDSPEEKPR